jgi:hypothetical protein
VSLINLRPRGDAAARRRGARVTRRKLLIATSVSSLVLAGAMGTAAAATTHTARHAPVVVHVLGASFHKTYSTDLSKVGAAAANAPKRLDRVRGASTGNIRESCVESNCPIPYNGGAVQHTPHVYLLFWGPNWFSDPTQDASASYVANFFNGLGNTTQDVWSPIMDQYGDGGGNISFGSSVLIGTYQDTTNPPFGVTQSQFAAEDNALVSFAGITDTTDADVVIVTQPGACPNGFAPGGCPGSHNYCAYHSYANSPYTNLPYQPDAGGSCGAYSVAGPLDGFSIVGGHEYAETATDPFINAWIDFSDGGGGEIGDKCAWQNLQETDLSTGAYPTQPLYSNNEYYGTGSGCTQNEFDLSMGSSGNSLVVGQSVTLTANTNISVSPTPWYIVIYDTTTSTVAAYCGLGASCSATITGLSAQSDNYESLIAHSDGSNVKLFGNSQFVTWSPASSTTAVSISTPLPTAGQSATVHVSVNGEFPGSGVAAPSGSVTVSDGTHSCLASLSGANGASTGSCVLSEPHAGSFTVSGHFAGDGNFTSSVGTAPLSVAKSASTTTFTLSKASIPYASQSKETFKITVSATLAGTPTGKAKIYSGLVVLCTATLVAGKGSCTLKAKELKKGTHKVYAYYLGDANHLTSAAAMKSLKLT